MSGENEVRIVNGETNRPLALDSELDPYARRAGRREFARRTLGQSAFCCACALEPELSFRAIDDDLLRETGPIAVGPHEGIELGIRQRRRLEPRISVAEFLEVRDDRFRALSTCLGMGHERDAVRSVDPLHAW